jgi:hypothetical protein
MIAAASMARALGCWHRPCGLTTNTAELWSLKLLVMNTYTFIDHSSALLVARQQELCLQHVG